MIGPQLRPRFEIKAPFAVEETITRLTEQSKGEHCPFDGTIAGNHMHLNIRKRDQKIWSPHLNLEILSDSAGSIIKGHFGPRPDIWTLIMALYAILGFLALMAFMFAAAQWMLDMNAWALWVAGGCVLLGFTVYLLALAGQALSQEQMRALLFEVNQAIITNGES